jgi:Spy/CpxP family protein refolding chaperone
MDILKGARQRFRRRSVPSHHQKGSALMSYGVQSAGLFGSSSSQTDGTSNSLRPFANLDLTEEQRQQIRSIFKTAKSDGSTQAEIQQQILAILTPTQQTTYQSDLAAQSSSSTSSDSTSSTSQSAAGAPPPPPPGGNPFADPNGPFANLDLTSSQQSQISSILQNGQSQGLTIDQINSQIDAVLTTSQQSTFATDLANLPSPPGTQGSSSSNDPLSNLGLTSDQKSQIDTILENAQTNGTSQSDVLAQIDAVLTPTQQSAFLQDVQTAQAIVSGQSQTGSGGTSASSTSTFSSTLTANAIQSQIAAATSLLLKQFQSEVG